MITMMGWTLFSIFVAVCSDLTFTRRYEPGRTAGYWTIAIVVLGCANSLLLCISRLLSEHLSVSPLSSVVGFPSPADNVISEPLSPPILLVSSDILLFLFGTAVALYAVRRLYTESKSAKIFAVSFYCLLAVILCGFVCSTIRMIFFDAFITSEHVLILTDIGIQLLLLAGALIIVSRYLAPQIKILKRDLHENFSGFLMVPVIAYGTYILNFSIWNSFGDGLTIYQISTSLLFIVLYTLIYWLILHGVITISRQYRTEQDLSAARDLQAAVLPSSAVLTGVPDLEISAAVTPAREVGGDFYDIIHLDDTHTAFVIADVSGKGIPAALFMMQAKTVLSDYIRMDLSPADALTGAAVRLKENNATCMFVTVFLGIFDAVSGIFTYSCAGHVPPVRKSSTEISCLGFLKEPFLGIKEHAYHNTSLTLNPDDLILLYTDGVTEAENRTGEFYGTSRLISVLRSAGSAASAVSAITGDLGQFTAGTEQSDDITLLAFRRRIPTVPLFVPARINYLPDVLGYLSGILASGGFSASAIARASLISEEIFTNIAQYAYPDSTLRIQNPCDIVREVLEISCFTELLES